MTTMVTTQTHNGTSDNEGQLLIAGPLKRSLKGWRTPREVMPSSRIRAKGSNPGIRNSVFTWRSQNVAIGSQALAVDEDAADGVADLRGSEPVPGRARHIEEALDE